ncbi:MAG TPA: response regulator [Candidatus Latescibacteria bacterium]|nr:response regulator [Candidatus Handelsmanbacteria bacterium]HIL09268.1 response regulator [Candidatus Latescibacterota bacterium]
MRQGGYELLITDWNMPQVSGLELVAKLRANPATTAMLIIMSRFVQSKRRYHRRDAGRS